ncbi:MAG: Antitoxin PemI [Pseudomonadota bacterium]|jgi:antitoxin ChpS
MSTATLRAVGGSVMMAVPKPILDLVQLQAGSQVTIEVKQGQLIISPVRKKRYTLAELVAQCDLSLPITDEEQAWLDAPAVGLEADLADAQEK